jgi:3-deoxy-D-manno-octulosonate 8-phosphate phosphatase (KDO 8-P phosphatase)
MNPTKELSPETAAKLAKIKAALTDVDGVLTDGGLYYTEDGMVQKRFQVKDGMGNHLLQKAGVKTGIITTDVTGMAKARAERMRVDYFKMGEWDKETAMREFCEEANISPEETAFIGDDVNDLGVLGAVGFSACPADAIDRVKDAVDYVCEKKGGEGAFRDLAELILRHRESG